MNAWADLSSRPTTSPMRLRSLAVLATFFLALPLLAQPGSTCDLAISIGTGTHVAATDDLWYLFTPATDGVYQASTCGLSTCDTKLWAYDECQGLVWDETGLNALAYNDDHCGYQSRILFNATAGVPYWIRVGDYNDACAGTPVDWALEPYSAPPDTCPAGQVQLDVLILPDGWPNEISWEVRNGGGALLGNGGPAGGQVCVDTSECVVFTIFDSYGDGIFAPGGYWLSYGGVQVASGGQNYDFEDRVELNCPPGFSCANPELVGEGNHTAPASDTWYSFVPAQNGMYQVSTCTGNTCDTKLWIYDYCTGLLWDDTNIGTIYYDDNNGGCGLQAQVNALLAGGETYYVRIGDAGGDCTGSPIAWSVNYMGPISGCMDPSACNFDPLAEMDDGSCLPWGDPGCPNGPDLIVLSDVLETSLQLTTINVGPNDCYITEGCLSGYGVRDILRFTTHIKNIGNTDYYIGNPNANPDQFNLSNCHGHVHYEGYAEYLLFDTAGQSLAQGFKNGFCVMDLECSGGGTAQYGCGNMGISQGCGDIYSSGLNCQWVDLTDVPDGTYTLVVRTNWDQSPDALGRYELDHFNNWAQVCVTLERNPNLTVVVDTTCTPYVDCLGDIYGSAQLDCMGDCGGTRLIGDLDLDGQQDLVDVNQYVTGIIGNDITPMPCTDIDADGEITVSDAAYMAFCNYWNTYNHVPDSNAVHDHCNFPFIEIVNPFDSVTFTIGDVDYGSGYLDVHIKNPNKKLVGYELVLSGVQITGVDNLYDPVNYPITPAFEFGGGHLIGLSDVDSLIGKNTAFTPLCRVHFINPQSLICIDEVVDVVNENYMNSTTFLQDACVTVTGLTEEAMALGVRVFPNPFRDETVLVYPQEFGTRVGVELLDLQGRVLRFLPGTPEGRVRIARGELSGGTYFYRLTGALRMTGRVVIE